MDNCRSLEGLLPVYVCRPGIDFHLPDNLCSYSPLITADDPSAARFFRFVDTPGSAQHLLFPFDLATPLQQIGVTATRQLLRSMITSFGTDEQRYIFVSSEDTSLPLELDSVFFQVSLNRMLHDRFAIAIPYLVRDPLVNNDLRFDALRYHTSFVGYPESHPIRKRLADLLSRVNSLQMYVETTPLHHGHISPQEQRIRKELYFKVICESLTVLCPRGAAENSIRFFETLAHGRIPVLIADHAVLPLESVIPYDDFVIRVAEDRLEQIADDILSWLGSRSDQQVLYACQQARDAWCRWLCHEQFPALVAHELGRITTSRQGDTLRVEAQETAVSPPPIAESPEPDQEILVSAIVSTYQSARFIRGCIEGLERQTIADRMEIIVIDSASPENEGEIVRELQGRYRNIRYLRTPERETVYAAWNRGIGMARGRYVTNANTDDRLRDDACETMAQILDTNPTVDLVYADVLITDTPNETFDQNSMSGRYSWFPWDRNLLLDQGCFIGPQPMWRRSLHDLYGGFDGACVTSGDYEFWLRISQTADFFHIRQPLGLYLARPDSIEHCHEETKRSENRQILERYHAAAREGRLTGFTPLLTLKNLAGQHATERQREIPALVEQIDTLIRQGNALPEGVWRDYCSARGELTSQGARTETIERYVTLAEKALLAGRDWFTRRCAAWGGTDRETLLRQKLLSTAVQQARLSAQRGEADTAADVLVKQGIRVAPGDPLPYVVLAEILIAAGRYADALEVVAEMPGSTDRAVALEVTAVCHSAMGEEEAAERAARQALALGGRRGRSLVVLGTIAARCGAVDEAEQLFRQAVRDDPAHGAGWLSLGMLLWGKGDRDAAWHALYRSMAVDPLREEATTLFREMSERLGRLTEALNHVARCALIYPECRHLALLQAELSVKCSREEQALEACEQFLVRFGADERILDIALGLRRNAGPYDRVATAGEEAVSLCMIVRDEERTLASCLASVKPVVHEIVVVDTGSSDSTAAIAAAFGAQVHHFTWNDDYSSARNASLSHAKGAWLLIMDADEALSARDYPLFRQTVRESAISPVAWSVTTRNYTNRTEREGWHANDGFYPDREQGDGWYPSKKVRLFPAHRQIGFRGDIHEMVEADLRAQGIPIEPARFVIHHFGELAEGDRRAKQLRYYELGKRKLAENPGDSAALVELALQAGELGLFDEALALWDQLLAQVPGTRDAYFNRSYALMKLHRYDAAAEEAARALTIDPDHKESAYNFGICQLNLGRPDRAADLVKRLHAIHPDYPLLMALLCVLYLCAGASAEAMRLYDSLQSRGYAVNDYIAERIRDLEALGQGEVADQLRRAAAYATP